MTKKFTDDEIEEYVERLEYKLIDVERIKYLKVTIKDFDGYYYTPLFDNFKRGQNLSKFEKSNPYTIRNIKLWCKLNNKSFELISDKYEGNNKKLKWKCLKENCGEEFEASWGNISQNNGCGFCAGKQIGISNCLATKNPQLASEWHPIKNGDLTPYDVAANSGKYAWWKCKECGNKWRTIIGNRNGINKTGCPECNKSKAEKIIKEILNLNHIYYIPQKTFDELIGLGGKYLSYDFYLPQYNLLIEYQGEFHDGSSSSYARNKLKKQQEHDKRKKKYAQNHNIDLLEIWYYDFNNIEKILEKRIIILESSKIITNNVKSNKLDLTYKKIINIKEEI